MEYSFAAIGRAGRSGRGVRRRVLPRFPPVVRWAVENPRATAASSTHLRTPEKDIRSWREDSGLPPWHAPKRRVSGSSWSGGADGRRLSSTSSPRARASTISIRPDSLKSSRPRTGWPDSSTPSMTIPVSGWRPGRPDPPDDWTRPCRATPWTDQNPDAGFFQTNPAARNTTRRSWRTPTPNRCPKRMPRIR